MRPSELAGDTTPSRDVVLHAMAWAEARGLRFDCVVLAAHVAFPHGRHLLRLSIWWSPDIDMVVSVAPSDANPYYNLFETDSDGMLHVCKGDGLFTRRQDAPKIWEYNGAVYCNHSPTPSRLCPWVSFRAVCPMSCRRSGIDLDTLADWQRAEQIIKRQKFMNRHENKGINHALGGVAEPQQASRRRRMTLFVVDDDRRVVGSLTDGDIRRALIAGALLADSVVSACHKSFRSVRDGLSPPTFRRFRSEGITIVPVLDGEGRLSDTLDLSRQHTLLPIGAILMAGGKGERLRPQPSPPKPLSKSRERPPIDYNIEALSRPAAYPTLRLPPAILPSKCTSTFHAPLPV